MIPLWLPRCHWYPPGANFLNPFSSKLVVNLYAFIPTFSKNFNAKGYTFFPQYWSQCGAGSAIKSRVVAAHAHNTIALQWTLLGKADALGRISRDYWKCALPDVVKTWWTCEEKPDVAFKAPGVWANQLLLVGGWGDWCGKNIYQLQPLTTQIRNILIKPSDINGKLWMLNERVYSKKYFTVNWTKYYTQPPNSGKMKNL